MPRLQLFKIRRQKVTLKEVASFFFFYIKKKKKGETIKLREHPKSFNYQVNEETC